MNLANLCYNPQPMGRHSTSWKKRAAFSTQLVYSLDRSRHGVTISFLDAILSTNLKHTNGRFEIQTRHSLYYKILQILWFIVYTLVFLLRYLDSDSSSPLAN